MFANATIGGATYSWFGVTVSDVLTTPIFVALFDSKQPFARSFARFMLS